ncbi:MAG: nuclear transport factor 2 family protein [Asgard group archaeon]|nr:nuclear transport factor 2 family protein [Asgard group archaeon]
MPSTNDNKDEFEINKILHDAFGWALTKDRALFESIFANDDDFFSYFPDSKSTAIGWSQFKKFLDEWMDPRNIAKGYEIRHLRIVLSKSKEVAWFSAIVDDEGEFDGKPWGSKNIRWTGILEKRDGDWKICQQHLSEANDQNK